MSASNSSAPESPPRVGYILKMFPRLSETFILNELLELETQGVEASVYSLMHPGDGRYHGRLGLLKLKTQFVPRDKPEVYWAALHDHAPEHVPPLADWQAAADFFRRWSIPKDLDLLIRAVWIAADARRQGIQHIHAHFATIATRVAAAVHLLTGIPFSFTSHAKDIFRDTVDRGLYRELVELAAFNITVSDFNRDYIIEKTPGVDSDKIVRLYNGIDLEYFSPTATPNPTAARRNGGVPHLVSVGRLVPKKGFPQLLNALRQLKDDGFAIRTTIVGDGEDEVMLHRHCTDLDLDDDVTFAGGCSQEEVLRLYREATLVALACVPDAIGNRDALPTTLLEALACDVPVVSTRLTGVPEIVTPEEGAVVEPDDVPALAGAITETTQRIMAGEFVPGACRRRAEELFDLRRNVGTLRGHFERSTREGKRD